MIISIITLLHCFKIRVFFLKFFFIEKKYFDGHPNMFLCLYFSFLLKTLGQYFQFSCLRWPSDKCYLKLLIKSLVIGMAMRFLKQATAKKRILDIFVELHLSLYSNNFFIGKGKEG